MGSKEHKAKVWEMISSIKVGMLVTDDQNELRARPMQIVQDQYDGTLWFYTDIKSSKVEEIYQDKNICLTFSCPKKKTYVSLSGKAKLNNEQELINKFWSPFVAAWFPEGKDSPNCTLLEIKINHGEHWKTDLSSSEYLFEVGKSNLTSSTPASNEAIKNEQF